MTDRTGQVRALCLFASGLDGRVAAAMLREQGVQVRGLTFTNPLTDTRGAVAAARELDVSQRLEDLTAPLVQVLSRSVREKYAPGAPCLEYHKAMLRRAIQVMPEEGCQFICTGSVVDQRAPLQAAESLARLEQAAGCEGWILRPLSARLLPPTRAEKEGWVKRVDLAALEGSSRREVERLARRYGLDPALSSASSTCCLTDPVFTRRVRDLCKHEGFNGSRTLQLLRMGRHFRLGDSIKLVVGRNEHENARIEGMTELYDLLLKPDGVRGPSALLPFTASAEQVQQAAAICVRYSDVEAGQPVRVRVRSSRSSHEVEVAACPTAEADGFRVDRLPPPQRREGHEH